MEPPVLNPKIRQVLTNNRIILVKNIVPCAELYSELEKQNVVPENQLKDIKAASSIEEKVDKISEMLCLRGKASVLRFCDALQMSGHGFLADILREEVSDTAQEALTSTELVKHLTQGRLGRAIKEVKEEELQDFVTYINDKLKENVVKRLWQRDSSDKVKAMDAKQKQLEDTWKYTEQLKVKDAEIRELKDNIRTCVREMEARDEQIQKYAQHLSAVKDSHQTDMEVQMKFNVAGEKSVQRVSDQLSETENVVRQMKVMLGRYFDIRDEVEKTVRRDSAHRYKDRSINLADKCKDLLDMLFERVHSLEVTEKMYIDLEADKHYLLTNMGAESEQGLRPAFQGFVIAQDEQRTQLNRQIQDCNEKLSAVMAAAETASQELQARIAEISEDVNTRDAQIKQLKDEIVRLRTVVSFQQDKKKDRRPSEPRFKNYEEPSQHHGTPVNDAASGKSHVTVSEKKVLVREGSARINLTLKRPITQQGASKVSQSYPGPAYSQTPASGNTLPPLTTSSSAIRVRPQRVAPSIPMNRGGKLAPDTLVFTKTTGVRDAQLAHVMKSANRKSTSRDPLQMGAIQRRDSMAGYVTNGNAYKAKAYRNG